MSVELIGILNVTPDSFSDGGLFIDPKVALAQAEQLFADGASIVDVGGEATNPKVEPITVDEEWRRIEPILSVLIPKYNAKISLDTYHPETVERASQYGKFIVNDVTTFYNPKMVEVATRHGLIALASHMPLAARGDFRASHRGELIGDARQVIDELVIQRDKMIAGGITPNKIILDPGIGFGKTPQLNWQLLEFPKLWLAAGQDPDQTFALGCSRKRFLARDPTTGELDESIDRNDPALSVAAAKIAINSLQPAQKLYLRVHDVKAYQELIKS